MMAPTASLPIEIVDTIVSKLATKSDQASLRSCGLACRNLYHMSRPHLFREMVFEAAIPMSATIHRLAVLLKIWSDALQNPLPNLLPMPSFFRMVSFTLEGLPHFFQPNEFGMTYPAAVVRANNLLLQSKEFIELLGKLCTLGNPVNTFVLDIRSPDQGMDYGGLSGDFQQTLRNLIRAPHISQVTLTGLLNLPPDLFDTCNLRVLTIARASKHGWDHRYFHSELHLDSLQTDGTFALSMFNHNNPLLISQAEGRQPALRHLKKFIATVDSVSALAEFEGVVQENDLSLTALSLHSKVDFMQFNPLNFGHLPNLTTIALKPTSNTTPYGELGQILYFMSTLNLNIAPLLETVVISMAMPVVSYEPLQKNLDSNSSWRKLDALLSSDQAPKLNKLRLILEVSNEEYDNLGPWRVGTIRMDRRYHSIISSLPKLMPHLWESPSVELYVTVGWGD